MDFLLFAAFLTTTLLFVAIPGPSVAFASAQAVKHVSHTAVVTVAGDAMGTMVHIIVAVGSLTALMALSTLVLPILQKAQVGRLVQHLNGFLSHWDPSHRKKQRTPNMKA